MRFETFTKEEMALKTNIEIPDGALERAKIEKLRQQTRAEAPAWLKLEGAFGQTEADRAETRRIQKEIDAEFERNEPVFPALRCGSTKFF